VSRAVANRRSTQLNPQFLSNQLNGTVKDIIFVGHQLEGGELEGKIIINVDSDLGLGIVENVTLAKDTYIQGGIFDGTVTGMRAKQLLKMPKSAHGPNYPMSLLAKVVKLTKVWKSELESALRMRT